MGARVGQTTTSGGDSSISISESLRWQGNNGWGDKGESNLWGKTKKEEEEERGRRAAQLGGRPEWVPPPC